MNWAFIIVSTLIAIMCVILAIVLDIGEIKDHTIAEFIGIFLCCCIPLFNLSVILIVGGMVLMDVIQHILENKHFAFLNKKPFKK